MPQIPPSCQRACPKVRLVCGVGEAHGPGMVPRSPLDDPRFADFAWTRYKRLMRLMSGITLVMVVAAMALLYRANGFVSIHFYIATALGIGFAMLLTSALMGLVFLSSGTGHDDAIADPMAEEDASGQTR